MINYHFSNNNLSNVSPPYDEECHIGMLTIYNSCVMACLDICWNTVIPYVPLNTISMVEDQDYSLRKSSSSFL